MNELNVNKKIIDELYHYDYKDFKKNRNFHRIENITDESFFNNIPSFDVKEINNVQQLLDEIENEALYELINDSDELLKKIIFLKYNGYSVKEISSILNIHIRKIYRKIDDLKKRIKKL